MAWCSECFSVRYPRGGMLPYLVTLMATRVLVLYM